MNKLAVIGAGITGLSVAYFLMENGLDVTVFEKGNTAGGLIGSVRQDGWLAETGPHSLSGSSGTLMDLIDQLELWDEVVFAGPAARKRFIVKNDQPIAIPSGIGDFLKTPLLSGRAKFRLFAEPFIKAGTSEDESLAGFTRRRLGREVLDYAVNPFIAGIYAGDPKQLSVKAAFPKLYKLEQEAGSLVRGLISGRKKPDHQHKKPSKKRRGIFSFKNGIGTLPEKLATELGERLRYNTDVKEIHKSDNGWNITLYGDQETPDIKKFDSIVLAVPAYIAAGLINSKDLDEFRSALGHIYYPPVSVVTLGFKRDDVGHPLDGFGMLVPEIESQNMLGTLFTSTLFPNRAPEGHVTLASFIGGSRQPDMAVLPFDKLLPRVMKSLGDLLEVTGEPVFSHHILRKHAIPQYNIGYDKIREIMNSYEQENPGLYLAGNYREGISVGDCIQYARKTCDRVMERKEN